MRHNRILLAGLAAMLSWLAVFSSSRPTLPERSSWLAAEPHSLGNQVHSHKVAGVLDRSPALRGERRKSGYSFFNRLPITFEVNQGQTSPEVKFIARGRGFWLGLTSSEAVFAFAGTGPLSSQLGVEPSPANWPLGIRDLRRGMHQSPKPSRTVGLLSGATAETVARASARALPDPATTIKMKLVGAHSSARAEGVDRLPGVSNYFLGNDPKRWRRNIPNYSKALFHEVYPGIDLVYYGKGHEVEFDFIVSPGGNPDSIQLAFEGIESLHLSPEGDMIVSASGHQIRQRKPRIYQVVGGVENEIPGRYVLAGSQVRFELSGFNPALALVIDPVLDFETTFGGSSPDNVWAIAVDLFGSLYLTGTTQSADFPVTSNAFSTRKDTAFVTKLSPSGDALVYSTFVGGSGTDVTAGIAVDAAGSAYVTGSTNSADFPITPSAAQPQLAGGNDAFVTKLNPSGSSLQFSTYLGGKDSEGGSRIDVDSQGSSFISGSTRSSDFPFTTSFPTSPPPGSRIRPLSPDVFVAKLNAAGTTRLYSVLVGGDRDDFEWDLAIDSSGNAFVGGSTSSSNFPTTPGAFLGSLQAGSDSFVFKLNATGTALVYSTFLGDKGVSSYHRLYDIAVDAAGNTLLSYTSTYSSLSGFLRRLNASGSAVDFSTSVAGGGAITLDSQGNIYTLYDSVLKKLSPGADAVLFTRILPRGIDPQIFFSDLAVDPAGAVYLGGYKRSEVTMTECNHFMIIRSYKKGDAYAAKIIDPGTARLFVPIVLSAAGLNNSSFSSELCLTNKGTREARLDFRYTAAFGEGSGTATDTLPAGQQQIVPDAIAYLRSLGIPIPPSGNVGGTLSIGFSGLSSSADAAASVRTTTPVSGGRAGLAYTAVSAEEAFEDPVYLYGLRQNSSDRSNVAIQNAGEPEDGTIVLRVTVFSGTPASSVGFVLPDETLAPGEFRQFSGILHSNGLQIDQGYVRVERVAGTARYYAYGVINDQVTSDGSFVPPVKRDATIDEPSLTIPVVVESGDYSTELILTNRNNAPMTVALGYVADAISNDNRTATLHVELKAQEQRIIPNFVEFLRSQGVSGIGPAGPTYSGILKVGDDRFGCRSLSGVFSSARVLTSKSAGGFGVFYPGVPAGDTASLFSVWLYNLRQDAETRTNLALANLGPAGTGSGPIDIRIELFDGDTGRKVRQLDGIRLEANEWKQMNSILFNFAPGVRQAYARVSRRNGLLPFLAYAVINDGGTPGERSGDGAFLQSTP